MNRVVIPHKEKQFEFRNPIVKAWAFDFQKLERKSVPKWVLDAVRLDELRRCIRGVTVYWEAPCGYKFRELRKGDWIVCWEGSVSVHSDSEFRWSFIEVQA